MNTQQYLQDQIENAVNIFKNKLEHDIRKNQRYSENQKSIEKLLEELFSSHKDLTKDLIAKYSGVIDIVRLSIPLMHLLGSLVKSQENKHPDKVISNDDFNIETLSAKLSSMVDSVPFLQDDTSKKDVCNYIVCKIFIILSNPSGSAPYSLNNLIKEIFNVDVKTQSSLKKIKVDCEKYKNSNSYWMSFINSHIEAHHYVFTIPEYFEDYNEYNRINQNSKFDKFVISQSLEKEILELLVNRINSYQSLAQSSVNWACNIVNYYTNVTQEDKKKKIVFLMEVLVASWTKTLTHGKLEMIEAESNGAIDATINPAHNSGTKNLYAKIKDEVAVLRAGVQATSADISRYYSSSTGDLTDLLSQVSSCSDFKNYKASIKIEMSKRISVCDVKKSPILKC